MNLTLPSGAQPPGCCERRGRTAKQSSRAPRNSCRFMGGDLPIAGHYTPGSEGQRQGAAPERASCRLRFEAMRLIYSPEYEVDIAAHGFHTQVSAGLRADGGSGEDTTACGARCSAFGKTDQHALER